jgi:hypothetical protein
LPIKKKVFWSDLGVARKIYQNLAFLDTKDGDENDNNAIIEETSDEASGGGGGEQYYHPGSSARQTTNTAAAAPTATATASNLPVTVIEEESEGMEEDLME